MMSRGIRLRALILYSLVVMALGGCGEIVSQRKIDAETRMVGGPAIPVTATAEQPVEKS